MDKLTAEEAVDKWFHRHRSFLEEQRQSGVIYVVGVCEKDGISTLYYMRDGRNLTHEVVYG